MGRMVGVPGRSEGRVRSADWITRLVTGAIIVVGLVLAFLEESDGAPLRSGGADARCKPCRMDAPSSPDPLPDAVVGRRAPRGCEVWVSPRCARSYASLGPVASAAARAGRG